MHSPGPGLRDIAHRSEIVIALNQRTDVLAASPSAIAAWSMYQPGHNIARAVFLGPDLDDVVERLPEALEQTVALIRAGVGPDESDAADIALVGELISRSPVFARLWSDPPPLRHSGTVRAHGAQSAFDGYRYTLTPCPAGPRIRVLTWLPPFR